MHKAIFWGLILFTFSSAAKAGCAEDVQAQCSYYKSGELKSQSACKVTTCAASDTYFFSTWEWSNGNVVEIKMDPDTKETTLNGKPTYGFPLPLKDDIVCFGVVDTDEMMCTNSQAF
ncbi:Uncharacterised protein [Leminorella richardii]|uniref:Secreted protein n=1 Tax=Leminorella richardii TaxID=158841 RepID=A0A2X4XM24_9GAMM|nr:hypothetical protein [Leminorella richardii]SQI40975.1 Uncharacterised protein [Leminorella richardii]